MDKQLGQFVRRLPAALLIFTLTAISHAQILSGILYQQSIAAASVSFAQQCGQNVGATGTAGCTLTGVAAGSTIIVGAMQQSGTQYSATLKDNTVSQGAQFTGYPKFVSSSYTDVLWVLTNVSAGTHALVVQWSFNPSSTMQAVVLTGASLTAPVDGTPSTSYQNVPGPANYTCPNVTTTQANEFLLSFLWINISSYYPSGAGTSPQTMTLGQNSYVGGNPGGFYEYGVSSILGSTAHVTYTIAAATSVQAVCDTLAIH